MNSSRHLHSIEGGLSLCGGAWDSAPLYIHEGRLADAAQPQGMRLDASDCLVLPGIVDFHGDAFERQIMPRPKVSFALDLALRDTDRQLAANGITTALHGVTLSWEGGLRGEKTAIGLFAALDRLAPSLSVAHKIHLRFECHHAAGEALAHEWLAQGRVSLLAFNDHLPGMLRKPHKWQEWADRAETDVAGFETRIQAAAKNANAVPELIRRLASTAQNHRVPMASHDDYSLAQRAAFAEMGCKISEFPLLLEVAEQARQQGAHVVCGAPNVLRGGSHVGAPRAADLARAGLCDILASDYYYPSPLHAACYLAAHEIMPLASAWQLISSNPAHALAMPEVGSLQTGMQADCLLLDARDLHQPRLVATIKAGRIVYLSEGERLYG